MWMHIGWVADMGAHWMGKGHGCTLMGSGRGWMSDG